MLKIGYEFKFCYQVWQLECKNKTVGVGTGQSDTEYNG